MIRVGAITLDEDVNDCNDAILEVGRVPLLNVNSVYA